MTCVHLRRLYQLCQQEGVKLSAPELIHIVCPSCGVKEVCPSQLMGDVEVPEHTEHHGEKGKARVSPEGGEAFSA